LRKTLLLLLLSLLLLLLPLLLLLLLPLLLLLLLLLLFLADGRRGSRRVPCSWGSRLRLGWCKPEHLLQLRLLRRCVRLRLCHDGGCHHLPGHVNRRNDARGRLRRGLRVRATHRRRVRRGLPGRCDSGLRLRRRRRRLL
jgi:hypothetical protein